MNACVLHSIGDIRYETVDDPVLGPGEVLVKIKASGICGSDIPRVFEKGTYSFPTIPGHEFAGEIVEAGEGADSALVGKRAAVFPLLPCFDCISCRVGKHAQCKSYDYFGSRRDGGFAEYLAVPVFNLVIVPDDMPFSHAALAEPMAVALHAISRAGVQGGDTVAIWGAGPIGIMLASWARRMGAGRIILIDIDDRRLEFAAGFGFCETCNPAKSDVREYINSLTRGRDADLSIEGSGASSALEQCLACTRAFGSVVCMGNPAGDMKLAQKAYWQLLRNELTVYGTWNSSYSDAENDWKAAIEALYRGQIDADRLITHRFDLPQGPEALKMMRDRSEFFNKVMLMPNGGDKQ